MKKLIPILTLGLLILSTSLALAQPDTSGPASGETAVTLTYTTSYPIPNDVPYDPDFRFDLTGEVRYEDDTPYGHRFMELHSQIRRTMTDSDGRFTMRQAEQGAHTLKALGTDNTVQGILRFRIDRTNTVDSTAVLTLPDGTTEVLANARVTALHLVLRLDGQGSLVLVSAEASGWQQDNNAAENRFNPATGTLKGPAAAPAAAMLLVLLTGAVWITAKKNNKSTTTTK